MYYLSSVVSVYLSVTYTFSDIPESSLLNQEWVCYSGTALAREHGV